MSLTLTVTEAAEQLGKSAPTVLAWIKSGHLRAFVPPGHDLSSKRSGPKGVVIFQSDWDRFLAANMVCGVRKPAPIPRPMPAGREVGPDGVERIKA
jgi:excisionase family DNA binding protein